MSNDDVYIKCARQNMEYAMKDFVKQLVNNVNTYIIPLVLGGRHDDVGFELFKKGLEHIHEYPPDVNWFGKFAWRYLHRGVPCIKFMLEEKKWKPNMKDIGLVTQTDKKKEFLESLFDTPCLVVSTNNNVLLIPKESCAVFIPVKTFYDVKRNSIGEIITIDNISVRDVLMDEWQIIKISNAIYDHLFIFELCCCKWYKIGAQHINYGLSDFSKCSVNDINTYIIPQILQGHDNDVIDLFKRAVGHIHEYHPNVNWFGLFAISHLNGSQCIKFMLEEKKWKPNIADFKCVSQTQYKQLFFETIYGSNSEMCYNNVWVFPKELRAFYLKNKNDLHCGFVILDKWVVRSIINIDSDMFLLELAEYKKDDVKKTSLNEALDIVYESSSDPLLRQQIIGFLLPKILQNLSV